MDYQEIIEHNKNCDPDSVILFCPNCKTNSLELVFSLNPNYHRCVKCGEYFGIRNKHYEIGEYDILFSREFTREERLELFLNIKKFLSKHFGIRYDYCEQLFKKSEDI